MLFVLGEFVGVRVEEATPGIIHMLSAEQRRKRILSVLARDRYESIGALSAAMRVSLMTIRRDLDRLGAEGLIRRTHGGAITESLGLVDLDYAARQNQNARAKRQIGQAAATLVHDDDVIFLDAGSTVLAMTKFLAGKRLTVVTHSLPIADRLAGREGIEVFLLGGQVRRDLMSAVGYRVEESLVTFRLDKAFLGTAGIDLDRGLNHSAPEEIPIKKLAARLASRVVVLADRTKIGRPGTIYFLPISEIDLFITDGKSRADIKTLGRKKPPATAGRRNRSSKIRTRGRM
jgi:DeoR family transcriptional regulator of aga operon/DeoR family fructose operon transcriptional repressor